MDYEVYIYRPYLLDKAQNSQPCSSCGLTSFWRPLPFGLRGFLKISAAFAVAQLTPENHNRFSSDSGLGTRRCTADSDSTIPSAVALGQKVKSSLWVFRQVGPKSFIPVTGFILKSRNHPFEQIGFPQHHHGKVLFLVPCFVFVFCISCL